MHFNFRNRYITNFFNYITNAITDKDIINRSNIWYGLSNIALIIGRWCLFSCDQPLKSSHPPQLKKKEKSLLPLLELPSSSPVVINTLWKKVNFPPKIFSVYKLVKYCQWSVNSRINIAALCPGDPGSNSSWFAASHSKIEK